MAIQRGGGRQREGGEIEKHNESTGRETQGKLGDKIRKF